MPAQATDAPAQIPAETAGSIEMQAVVLREPGRPVHVTELAEGGAPIAKGAGLERARLAVTKAIKAALARIDAAHPELGRHLTVTAVRKAVEQFGIGIVGERVLAVNGRASRVEVRVSQTVPAGGH